MLTPSPTEKPAAVTRSHFHRTPRTKPHTSGGAPSQLSHPAVTAPNFPDTTGPSPEDASTHLQETVISTLVAGMLPVIGSKSYTDDMSSSLSTTSPSTISIARSRGGSGLIREPHSLALTERVESPFTPETRSETRWPPVRAGEAATSQMFEREEGGREGGRGE